MGKTACWVGPGLVAVGHGDPDGDADGLVWASADGSAWTLLDLEETVFGGPGDQVVSSVAAGVDSSRGNDDEAVWVSAAGHTWGRLLHDQAIFGGPGRRETGFLVVGRVGLIAVGSVGMGGDDDAAVWLSRSLG